MFRYICLIHSLHSCSFFIEVKSEFPYIFISYACIQHYMPCSQQRILIGNSKKGQLEKIFNFTLHQKMQVKITEKYSVTYQTESVGEDERKHRRQKCKQVQCLQRTIFKKKKKAENISVLWPRDYPSSYLLVRKYHPETSEGM